MVLESGPPKPTHFSLDLEFLSQDLVRNGSDLSIKEPDRKRKRNTIPKSQTLAKMRHPGLT
jgi:hypothetical protein